MFGESNDPLLYQIKREMIIFSESNLSIMVYFTKKKKLWDELLCLRPLPTCSWGASKRLNESDNSDKLIQFLIVTWLKIKYC